MIAAPTLSMLLATISGALALPMLIEAVQSLSRRAQRKQRALGDSGKGSLARDLLRNGLPPLRLPAGLLMRAKPWREATGSLWRHLQTQDYQCSAEHVSELLAAASLLAGLAAWLVFGQPVFGAAAAMALPLLAGSQASGKLLKYDALMREQLPDALQCLGFCFLAGCSLSQAIEQTAAETPEPLRRELMLLSDDLQSGLQIKEALAALEARNSLPEISFLAVALEIQHQTGGSLKDLLESAAESVRTAVTLKKQLQVQTAQARLSFKVVAFMPAVLVAVLSIAMDGYLESFFNSTAGLLILVTAVTMEAIGILAIRRILGVDLG